MNQNTQLFGLVTRVEDGHIFIWSTSHRLTEAITYEHLYSDITVCFIFIWYVKFNSG